MIYFKSKDIGSSDSVILGWYDRKSDAPDIWYVLYVTMSKGEIYIDFWIYMYNQSLILKYNTQSEHFITLLKFIFSSALLICCGSAVILD